MNGFNKILFSLLCVWLLNACSTVFGGSVKSSDVQGVWESVGFVPYARLVFSDSGDGVLVAIYSEESDAVFKLNNFELTDDGFYIDVSGNGETEKLVGGFFNGQLNLKGITDDDDGVWFTREERLEQYKRYALEKLKSHSLEE